MRWLALAVLLFLPLASAIDIGDFKWEDGKITGKYMPAGLEGKISCYSRGKHILDIIYRNESIEISIQYFDALDKIIERNPFLKKELEEALVKQAMHINISGAAFKIEYEGCKIELHDTPTRFLRVTCDKIVVSDFSYNVTKLENNIVKMEKENFSATLLSDNTIVTNEENVTAYGDLMLVSFSFEEERKMEDAFKNKTIGGEITIVDYSEDKVDSISYFGNVTITPAKLSRGKIILNVTGDARSGGKIIKINLGKNVCISDEFTIKFDGRRINQASNFEDILNPDDDGIEPEYYILSPVSSNEGMFVLVTIPHFSDHQLSIEFIVENVFAKIAAIAMGFLVIALASFYMFKK